MKSVLDHLQGITVNQLVNEIIDRHVRDFHILGGGPFVFTARE
ncbi:MAG: hypothetical protein ACI85J_000820 [Candidatus Poriferisodalaceae bacterium]|jgi:hypothetical protein|tara:strand:+ start:47 stop:175 length:129 start_codon:yes stop_codon:yes gene_type:complete